MPEVLFLHKGRHAASTRYRALQYGECLQQGGWTLREMQVSGSVVQYGKALAAVRRADVVVVLKKPYTPVFRYLLRRAASRLVFDYDDAVYVYDDGSGNRRRLAQFQSMLSICDEVWAGNSELMQAAVPYAANSVLLPTTLPTQKYSAKAPQPDTSIDLVWIGGSASRPWLESILPTLEKAAKRVPGLRLKIIADFVLPSDTLTVEAVRWSEEGEARELASAHIGIAPLPNNAFTRGKCGLKILQYMAAGLPVIASPTSVQADMIQEHVNGLLADSEHGWIEAICKLATDAHLRQKMGLAGRLLCEQKYDLSVGCETMLTRLRQMLLEKRDD